MKHIFILIFSLVTLFTISSCDRIDPYNSKKEKTIDTNSTNTLKKKVLLVEFTGYRCGQCPPAAELAHKYKEENNGKVILMSVHSGGFAKPLTAHFVDFQNADADLLYNICSATNNPAAAVNFKKFAGGSTIVTDFTKSNLDPKISDILKEDANISINLKLTKNNNIINLEVKSKYLVASGNSNENLVVYVVEDSIVSWQLDYRIDTNNSWLDEYEHNSVLRSSLNGVVGESLASGLIAKDTEFIKSFIYSADVSKVNLNKIRFIACVIDKTSYEIKQVEEIKVLK